MPSRSENDPLPLPDYTPYQEKLKEWRKRAAEDVMIFIEQPPEGWPSWLTDHL